MRGQANAGAVQLHAMTAGGAGLAASATIVAVADQYWVIDSVHFGYNGIVTAPEALSILFGGVAKFGVTIPIPVTDKLPQQAFYEIHFPRGLYTGVLNEEVKVSLSPAGGALLATVNVTYR